MVQQGIIVLVTTPTAWIRSMVVVPKKNGKLCICLDPKDLKKAILWEHYPLLTIKDIATWLHGARLFTILDVLCGFWYVPLDKSSLILTTYHTTFGEYCWKQMPFGICSAPEVIQRQMHQLIEGLHGVEVVADNIVVVGFVDTKEKASVDPYQNVDAFLQF